MEMYRVTTNELYHHGIIGQRWGVRRYQNEDGTLTEKGKRRKETANSLARNANVGTSAKMKEARRRDINELTNDELKAYNERLNLEKQYKDLTKGSIYTGRTFVDGLAKTVVTGVVTGIGIELGKKAIKKLIESGAGGAG